MGLVTNVLVGGGTIVAGLIAYDYLQKRKKAKEQVGVLNAVGIPAKLARVGRKVSVPAPRGKAMMVRPGAKRAIMASRLPTSVGVPKTSKFSAKTPVLKASKFRTSIKSFRPQTLSECCDTLCLPSLKRTVRPAPVLEQNVNFMRNIIQYDGNIPWC